MSIKVTCFAASSSRNSINKKLASYAAGLLENVEIEILDLNDYELPLFSVDREAELGQPPLAQAFLDKIQGSDALDWVSRIEPKVYRGKRLLLLSTSPGGRGGRSVMELALAQMPRFGGDVRGSVSVPSFEENFDSDRGLVSNADIDAEIREGVKRLLSDD